MVSRRYWAVRGGIREFEGNAKFCGQRPLIWEAFWAEEFGC